MEYLELPKIRQATCLVWYGTRDCSRSNTEESGGISGWFGIHWRDSHSLVISVSFLTCEGVLWYSLNFHQANTYSLLLWLGAWNCSARNAGESGLVTHLGRSLTVFLELRGEPVVYSRLTAGMAIQNSCLFSHVRTTVYLWWIPQESKLGLAGQYRRF